MKYIFYFKTLLNIILIMGIAGLVFIPFVLAFSPNVIIDEKPVEFWNSLLILKAMIPLVVYIVMLVGIYKLREAMEDFYQNQLFNNKISRAFRHIGFLVIVGTLFHVVLTWLVDNAFSDTISFGLDFIYLIHTAIALFFFTLSTMIDKAKGIQQENDLTI